MQPLTADQEIFLRNAEDNAIGVFRIKKVHPKSATLVHVGGAPVVKTTRPVDLTRISKLRVR